MARKIPNGFLYFLESGDVSVSTAVNSMLIDRLGTWHKRPARLGDKQGSLITCTTMSGAFERIDESAQTWMPVDVLPGMHVGVWKGHKPTEEDLRKPDGILGQKVRMLDGQEWTLPVLMYDTGKGPVSMAPSALVYRQGRWESHVREEFKPVASKALGVHSKIAATLAEIDRQQKLTSCPTVGECVEFVAVGLALNYRVGPEEVGLLGILDPSLILQHAGAMVGFNLMKRLLEIEEGKQGLGESV